MNTPVFMYHALYHEESLLAGADKVYAISYKTFDGHIRFCELEKRKICSLADLYAKSFIQTSPVCVFTFDDGHISNYEAMLKLIEKGYSADLFVNSAFINTENYMTDSQLKEVSDAGISVQSHGHEHPYFSDLSDDEVYYQLNESKKVIEGITGKTVNIFAPPGGRINPNVIQIAKKLGYICIANSKPGVIKNNPDQFNIPRLPIQQHTSEQTIKDWLKPKAEGVLGLQCKYNITKIAKTVLGNKRYEALRSKVLN
ncbi:polysaccharide deacetylase family protein [Aliikangiella sp. IMCC44359]|uniref:polysaccharide deacetylase family protein n=1 Tax=Aliikangiella sp. IMCC44359 TaxID=3459125 RepID=UPI00403B1F4B